MISPRRVTGTELLPVLSELEICLSELTCVLSVSEWRVDKRSHDGSHTYTYQLVLRLSLPLPPVCSLFFDGAPMVPRVFRNLERPRLDDRKIDDQTFQGQRETEGLGLSYLLCTDIWSPLRPENNLRMSLPSRPKPSFIGP